MSRSRDDGQATVELALSLPLVATLLLGVIQAGLVVGDQLRVVDAARVGARAAAVAGDPSAAARDAVAAHTPSARTVVHIDGSLVTVHVSMPSPTDVAMIGAVVGDVTVSGSATMLLDPP